MKSMKSSSELMWSVAFLTALAIATSVTGWADEPSNDSASKETELLNVLRSDATPAEKAITCKLLAIHGSSIAVSELALLLPDPELSSWARIALEAIPGPESDSALRDAVESLKGRLLVGVINSIGVRKDEKAVEPLSSRLKDADPDVAAAAAVALGHIGNEPATTSLRAALTTAPLKVRSAVAEGCVLCAEQRLLAGDSEKAVAIYDEVRKADVPKQRIIEATRGAILSRGQAGVPLLVEQLQSPDKQLFQLGLGTAREFPGSEIDQALAAELKTTSPERASLLVLAMADRAETVVLEAVLEAAENGPKMVRLAAIEALSKVGNLSCLSPLLKIAIEQDADINGIAKTTLAGLPGKDIDAQIVALLPNTEGKTYPVLLELVGQRRINAAKELKKALNHQDEVVRAAALGALGETVAPDDLSVLISEVVDPKHANDRPVALQALKAASVRMPDREVCATELAAAIEQAPVQTQVALLEILGAVGGTKALSAMGEAAIDPEPLLQDASTRLLGEWMTADAAPVLLDLTTKTPGEKFQVRALRGYIRIARQFVLPEEERVEMCRKALSASRQPAEQKLVLDVLKRYPSVEMLKLAINALQTSEIKEEATEATLFIAQKIGTKSDDVTKLLATAGLEKIKLEIVKAEYGAGTVQKDVTEVIKKQAGDLPVISLAKSYNASFGGDPVPGSVKQLKIHYRINGKEGVAMFAENALILLPIPK